MEIAVRSENKTDKSPMVAVSDAVFGQDFNEPLVHQVVTSYLTNARAGTKAQKTRSEVRGGGIKPWRQKGTGRARAGTIRSPLWRKGGVVFAAKPRDYSQKVNRKMYRLAMKVILSELLRQERIVIIDEFKVDSPKTKNLLQKLRHFGHEKTLLILDAVEDNLFLAARNIPYIEVIDVQAINPLSLVAYEKIIMTPESIKQVEEALS